MVINDISVTSNVRLRNEYSVAHESFLRNYNNYQTLKMINTILAQMVGQH